MTVGVLRKKKFQAPKRTRRPSLGKETNDRRTTVSLPMTDGGRRRRGISGGMVGVWGGAGAPRGRRAQWLVSQPAEPGWPHTGGTRPEQSASRKKKENRSGQEKIKKKSHHLPGV